MEEENEMAEVETVHLVLRLVASRCSTPSLSQELVGTVNGCSSYLSSWWLSSPSLSSSSSTKCPNGSEEMDTILERMRRQSLLAVNTSWSVLTGSWTLRTSQNLTLQSSPQLAR
ncbi:hypothetical protein EYF80_024315 [Liparis tanakae]|uniref:Uncharacterized protein n=1 Tax=Liparis tanakae TaxID=230148 RepID=A0A4Z2HI90_9TELE|nr:hypothetical protein EYF80_024315 [Liparis tanakae]